MKLASYEAVIAALNDAGVRYLVAGGLAVNAHGYLRFTHDLDLVVVRFVSQDTLIAMNHGGSAAGPRRYPASSVDQGRPRVRESDPRTDAEIDWSLMSWEGSRRAQLRAWCRLTLRERFEALDGMHELAEQFARMRAQGRFRTVSAQSDQPIPGAPIPHGSTRR